MNCFLSQQEQIFQLFHQQSDSILVVNNVGNILYVNPQAEKLFNRKDLINRPITSVILNYTKNETAERQDDIYIGIKDSAHYFKVSLQSQMIPIQEEMFEVLLLHNIDDKGLQREIDDERKINFINTMNNLQNGIFSMKKDEKGNLLYTMAVGKLLDDIGVNAATLTNKTPFDVFSDEVAFIKQEHYEKAFKGNRSAYEIELNGKSIFVDVTPVIEGDKIVEIVGTVLDISELKYAQKALQLNQEQFQTLLNNSEEYIFILDAESKIIEMNPHTEWLVGLSKENSNILLKDLIPEIYNHTIKPYFEKSLQGTVQTFNLDIETRKLGHIFFNVTLFPILMNNEIQGVYLIGKDITEQKKIQDMNAYLAHHDELTTLFNRRWMEKEIAKTLQHAKANELKLAVLLIDLDRFKSINDTLGHLVGDQLLKQIGERLLLSIDHNKQFAARMGGDEFMIMCTDICSEAEVIKIAEAFLESMTLPIYIDEFELLITASIGISFYPTDGNSVVDLMKKADIALYKSKDLGRNTYQIFDQSMSRRSYQSLILERDLRKAVLNDEFIAHFQPRVDALTGKTVSAEALIRWEHPVAGLVSPGEFIPLAEETGLIIPMGKWMKRKVCEQLVAWRKAGIPLIPISVNISSQRFLQRSFSSDIRNLLNEYQLEGKWLELEITENSIMRNEESVTKTLRELKELGVKIYIDDFGTGYSSFNYLKTFQLDGVKIDRSFIQNISSESENASITTAMIKVAQHLKLDVIAEGVETKQELDYLVEQNCHQIQGYYFGKPCPIEEFEEKFLRNR